MSKSVPTNNAPSVRFLEGVTVLEIANLAPTQLGMHLADLGAEVIKIEPPKRGDATRLIATRPGFADSSLHRRWNRGKKSVAIDMTTKEGVALFLRLIPNVDIVIEGLRPGSLEKMGVSWEQMTALNPDLVMVALSGWGQAGPYRTMGSHGIGFDAIAGLAEVKKDESGQPKVLARHVNMGTLLAPLFGATAALAALNWSRRTGKPVFLDVAQANAACFANFAIENTAAMRSAEAAGTLPPPAPPGPAQSIAEGQAMQSYLTRDGQILLLMALERKFFVRLAEAVGRPDLLDHIAKDEYLVRGNQVFEQVLAEVIATKDLGDWMAIFAAADVPVVPVYQGTEALDDIHMRTRLEWLPSAQGTVTMKSPVQTHPRSADPVPAPRIGQDTMEVLSKVGVTGTEAERLAAAGIIRVDKRKG
jgi:crotonobetainyl-CoA:carnitine CoA-transferase CaiB-like acyl-CoA transferase